LQKWGIFVATLANSILQKTYWGPPDGFPLAATYQATTQFTAIFSTAGQYTITFSLVDLETGKELVKETVTIAVGECDYRVISNILRAIVVVMDGTE